MFKKFFTAWKTILLIIAHEFSLPQLLRTLFAPWRRDIAPPGGSLDEIFRHLVENLISRLVGFLVRFFAILACLIFETVILILGALVFILFLLFSPFILLLFRPSNLPRLTSQTPKATFINYLDKDAREIYRKKKNYSQSPRILFILNHLGIVKEVFGSFENQIKNLEPDALLSQASQMTIKSKEETISAPALFYGAYLLSLPLQKFFEGLKINKNDIENLCLWEAAFYRALHQPSTLFHPELYRTTGGVGRLWAAGYTPNLDRFSQEITASISSFSPLHFESHKKVIDGAEIILGRSGKHNLILVGEPGAGKRTTALGFAQRVLVGQIVPSLAHHRVIELNVDTILAGAGSISEIEERFVTILNEAVRAGNIILFIDNIERIFESKEAKGGTLDVSAILLPYLQRNDFQLIGTTNYQEYHKWIESNPRLASSLEKIEIKEPDKEEVLKILQEVSIYAEAKHQILILYRALKEIVNLAEKYLPEKKFPEKAIDLLDECCSYLVNQKRGKILFPQDVAGLISLKTEIPFGEIEKTEKDKLLKLEEEFHQRLVNQEEAVKAIAEALRRARTGLEVKNKPIGSFLFLGPTGVGKTECAKTLARIYFGGEKNIIRFDMSEFQQTEAITRFIGGRLGEPGLLTSRVREKPFSLILLDEIEKAHPGILDLFLQILDEGRLTDSLGQTADLKNTIIIATSNAGSEWIREWLKNNKPIDKTAFLEYLLRERFFKPEFLNRFDAVVAFRPLNLEELEKVVELLVGDIKKQLTEKQIILKLEPAARRKLAVLGFNPQFGARALYRIIQEKVENQLAKAILEDKLSAGSTFTISEEILK